MEKLVFEGVNETIYKEVLDNGIEVYLYPFTSTKNFYCTISVKYGAMYEKYRLNNKTYNIIPGTAHFLEHRIMLIGEDQELSNRINKLGSMANAWTSSKATNYNIYGSENINENIKILLDLFHNVKFEKKDVDDEKLIIGEEIDRSDDNIGRYLSNKVDQNMFFKSYARHTTLGTKEDISKITPKSLQKIYDDFYTPSNSFIVISGNFNKEEVLDEIKEYYKKLNLKKKEVPKRIVSKEPESVRVNYEEYKKDVESTKIRYAFKMKKKIFGMKEDDVLSVYLNTILTLNFSASSKLFEKYKNTGLIHKLGTQASVIDDYVVFYISADTEKPKQFIKHIKEDINKLTINKEEFERIKKRKLKAFIMNFENIEDVEYIIVASLTDDNKIDLDEYSFIKNLSFKTAEKLLKKIDTKNSLVIRTVK